MVTSAAKLGPASGPVRRARAAAARTAAGTGAESAGTAGAAWAGAVSVRAVAVAVVLRVAGLAGVVRAGRRGRTGAARAGAAGCLRAGRAAAWVGVRAGRGGAAVAFLEQVKVAADAEFLQGAGDAGGAQVQGPLLDVLPRGQDLIGRELARDHPGVAGVFPEPAHVGVLPGGLFAPLGGFRVQLQHQAVRGRSQLPERQRSGHLGQHGVGLGRVLVT
jgi:hypothetical protein